MELAVTRAGQSPSDPTSSAPPLSVLVVIKDATLAASVKRRLVSLQCEVTAVTNGHAASEAFDEQAFDVLIIDWDALSFDGGDISHRLRDATDQLSYHVLITEYDNAQALQYALEAGFDGLVQKPFTGVHMAFQIAKARRALGLQKQLIKQNQLLEDARKESASQIKRLRDDLQAAAELQRGLLPTPIASGPIRLVSFFQPSDEIGGDVLGTQPLDDGSLLFFNVDVAGHGVPAALEAFALHSRLAFPPPETPSRLQFVAGRLNAELLSRDGRCATMVLGILAADGSSVVMLRAGHPHPLLVPKDGAPRFVHEGGLPLGVMPNAFQPLVNVSLAPGDRLVVYSDGVTDGNGEGGGLGNEGLRAFWSAMKNEPVDAAIVNMEEKLRQANRGRPPTDDISVLVIERAP
jgi:sigma-B regulation protein RsbU (phosphoserine phosphatase)